MLAKRIAGKLAPAAFQRPITLEKELSVLRVEVASTITKSGDVPESSVMISASVNETAAFAGILMPTSSLFGNSERTFGLNDAASVMIGGRIRRRSP